MEELYKVLAEASRSSRCLEYDACPLGEGLIVNIDGYSMSESRLPWTRVMDWAWKSVVAAASDIAASGGRPLAVMYSIGVESVEMAMEIARGVGQAADWLDVEVLKSDTNRCRGDAWIDVAVIGASEKPIPRSGASPGDVVVQIGYTGYGAVAKLILDGVIGRESVDNAVMDYIRRPRPPIKMGPTLPRCSVSAASDNSDGLAYTIASIAEASSVSIALEDPLIDPKVARILEEVTPDAGEAAFNSWEDYNLVATIPSSQVDCILDRCQAMGVPCRIIGEVGRGKGVVYRGRVIEARGWTWL